MSIAHSIPHIYSADPLWFERLLTDLLMPFTALPSNQVDRTIKATQKAICVALRLEHSELAQWNATANRFEITHSAVMDPFRIGRTLARQDIPWMSANIFHGDVIHFTRKSKSCDQAATDIEKIFLGKIQSAIFIPLTIGKQVFGFLCFGTSGTGTEWSKQFQ